jgi:hypothetical protein
MRICKSFLLVFLLVCGLHAHALADGMAMAFMPMTEIPRESRWEHVTQDQDVAAYDPLRVRIYEPAQRAEILFNGRQQILCLSTELHASEATAVLEMIPFPSEPTVTLGAFAIMQAAEKLMLDHAPPRYIPMPGSAQAISGSAGSLPEPLDRRTEAQKIEQSARLTFHEKMGAHDIAVIEVVDTQYFRKWVDAFFEKRGAVNATVREEHLAIVEDYLARDFKWFVFDTLYLTDSVQSREPVEYVFNTDHLYYPLLTSTGQAGHTAVDLLVIKPVLLHIDWPKEPHLRRVTGARVTRTDLAEVSSDWAKFIARLDVDIDMYHIDGHLADLRQDLIAYPAYVRTGK